MILNFGDEILLRGVDWNNPSRVLLYKKSIFVFLLSLGYLFFLKLFLILNWWARGAHPLNFFLCFPVSLSSLSSSPSLSHSRNSLSLSFQSLSKPSLFSHSDHTHKTTHAQGHLTKTTLTPTLPPPSSSRPWEHEQHRSKKLRRVLLPLSDR